MQKGVPQLPFTIDRASQDSLVNQVIRGITGARSAGTISPGQRLPAIRDMAELLGVGEIVIRQAIRQLSEQGTVVSRRKTGIHLSPGEQRSWRAHVVLIYCSNASFFIARNQGLLEALDAQHVRLSDIHLGQPQTAALQRLRILLDSQHVDLVALDGEASFLAEFCDQRQQPFVCLGSTSPSAFFRGSLLYDYAAAWRELGTHLLTQGAKNAAVLPCRDQLPESHRAALKGLRQSGLSIMPIALDHSLERDLPPDHLGFVATQTLTASWKPDALIFLDDWVARGGLLALADKGLRYPEHLLVATHSNRGQVPCAPCTLTRVEVDPGLLGRTAAVTILHAIGMVNEAPARLVGNTFIPGQSSLRMVHS